MLYFRSRTDARSADSVLERTTIFAEENGADRIALIVAWRSRAGEIIDATDKAGDRQRRLNIVFDALEARVGRHGPFDLYRSTRRAARRAVQLAQGVGKHRKVGPRRQCWNRRIRPAEMPKLGGRLQV